MRNLLILGAGQYGMFAKEVAESMDEFDRIEFLDDVNPIAVGKLNDDPRLYEKYQSTIVAIGNAELRLQLLSKLKEGGYELPELIHKRAYVSPSAEIGEGSIIEPMVTIHSGVKIGTGCFISAGAIINHNAVVKEGCHIDCGTVIGARAIVAECTTTIYGAVITE